MSGLLLKDWYIMKKDCRYVLGITVLFAVCGLFVKSLFWALWPPLMASTVPSSIIGLEEQAGWSLYADSFPVSRRTVVREKYTLALLLALAVTVLLTVLYTVSGVAKEIGLGIPYLAALSMTVGLLPVVLMLPMTFKLGMVKGRIAYIISIAVTAAMGGALGSIAGRVTPNSPLKVSAAWLPLMMIVIILLLLGVSYTLAVKFYEKREL